MSMSDQHIELLEAAGGRCPEIPDDVQIVHSTVIETNRRGSVIVSTLWTSHSNLGDDWCLRVGADGEYPEDYLIGYAPDANLLLWSKGEE